jgi:hypothetical protein
MILQEGFDWVAQLEIERYRPSSDTRRCDAWLEVKYPALVPSRGSRPLGIAALKGDSALLEWRRQKILKLDAWRLDELYGVDLIT